MLHLDGSPLTLDDLHAVAYDHSPVALASSARERMAASRSVIERILIEHAPVYGVNTGFGKLSDVQIPDEDLARLQLNLVRSHACGVGELLSAPEVRAMMLLRANVLAKGASGARPKVAELLIKMLNRSVHPAIPSRGSVGASGDLAPLAHLALVVIGEGFALPDLLGADAMRAAGLDPIVLQAKEGLALLNGTQAIGAVGGLALRRARRLAELADVAGAMTLEALRDTPSAFDARIQELRPHPGQIAAATHLRELLADSEIVESHRVGDTRVQDAYAIRCMPQVHGAVRGALAHAEDVLRIETGSGTDNPLVFADEGEVISGGNFHGAPLGYALDYAAIAITDLASISERRIERLVNPDLSEGLPAFLTSDAGTSSGFMMAQVTAAALLCECRILAHPASIDNVPTSAGKEDHVSMGMTAALKFRDLVELAERVLAIEFLAAAEGLRYREPMQPGRRLIPYVQLVREIAPPVTEDRALGYDIERIASAIRDGKFDV